MEHAPLQGYGGVCSRCEQEWKAFVIEWPPKIVICPVCQDLMVLRDYNEHDESAIYQRQPQREQNNE